jgi:hypothetical protein
MQKVLFSIAPKVGSLGVYSVNCHSDKLDAAKQSLAHVTKPQFKLGLNKLGCLTGQPLHPSQSLDPRSFSKYQPKPQRGARKLTGENLKVVWAEFSTLR